MPIYYHYTTPQSAQEILRTGMIKKSTTKAKSRDAVYGEGVYLTQIPPTTQRYLIALNNYDGAIQFINQNIADGEHALIR